MYVHFRWALPFPISLPVHVCHRALPDNGWDGTCSPHGERGRADVGAEADVLFETGEFALWELIVR